MVQTMNPIAYLSKSMPRLTVASAYLLMFVIVQSPVAYTPGKPHAPEPLAKLRTPISPVQAMARGVLESRKDVVGVTGQQQNATIMEFVVSVAAFPGNAIRMNNFTNFNATAELGRAIQLSAIRTFWWSDVHEAGQQKSLLFSSQLVCFSAIGLPLIKRAQTRVVLSVFICSGLLALLAIAVHFNWSPTPQAGVAVLASACELYFNVVTMLRDDGAAAQPTNATPEKKGKAGKGPGKKKKQT